MHSVARLRGLVPRARALILSQAVKAECFIVKEIPILTCRVCRIP
jgi:hypothetical protein